MIEITNTSPFHLPIGTISGFDKLNTDVIGCIAEYAGCVSKKPSWNVYRHEFYDFFKERIKPTKEWENWENELNTEYSFFQKYLKIASHWKLNTTLFSSFYLIPSSWGLTHHLNHLTRNKICYSSPTINQYLLNCDRCFGSYGKNEFTKRISKACNIINKSGIPTPRLHEVLKDMQITSEDSGPNQAQSVNNKPKRLGLKQVLSCAVGVCLIAIRILLVPLLATFVSIRYNLPLINRELLNLSNLSSNSTKLITLCIATVLWHIILPMLLRMGSRDSRDSRDSRPAWTWNAEWNKQKENFQDMIISIKHIWRSRELITELYIKGTASHISLVIDCMRRLGPIQGLRQGCYTLSKIIWENGFKGFVAEFPIEL